MDCPNACAPASPCRAGLPVDTGEDHATLLIAEGAQAARSGSSAFDEILRSGADDGGFAK